MAYEYCGPDFTYAEDVVGLSPETTMKYTIPYDWGTFRVSEAADEFYGFVPLTAETQDGDVGDIPQGGSKFLPRVDIFLVSPEEKSFPDDGEIDASPLAVPIAVDAKLHGNDIIVQAALGTNAVNLEQSMRETNERMQAMSVAEIDMPDLTAEDITQLQIHALGETMIRAVDPLAVAAIERADVKSDRRILNAIAGICIAYNGVVVSADALQGNAGITSLALLGAFNSLNIFNLMRTNRRQIERRLVSGPFVTQAAQNLSATVGYDLHASFCSGHFNREAERLFNGDGGESLQ